MKLPGTYKVTPEHGPRPAGKADECFYCGQRIGTDHAVGCVMRKRAIVMSYTYEVTVLVPEDWDADMAEFARNESSSCADNTIRDITRRLESRCWCGDFDAKYLREAEPGDYQKFELNSLTD